MPVDRLLPTDEARELIRLTREIADKALEPIVDHHERMETYPEGAFAILGAAGLLSLPYPEEWGAGISRTRFTCKCWKRSPHDGRRSRWQ